MLISRLPVLSSEAVFICLLLLFSSISVWGQKEEVKVTSGNQKLIHCGVFPEHKASETLSAEQIVYDRFGNSFSKEELNKIVQDKNSMNCANSEDFEVFFSSPAHWSVSEREVICQVFGELSDLIDAPGQPVRILFRKSNVMPDGVAGRGTSYFYANCGVYTDIVRAGLQYGSDVSFGPDDIQGMIEIDGTAENFYFDNATPIGATEIDFYSIVLHEALHLLGFGSVIGSDGLGANSSYTVWDTYLETSGGQSLVNSVPAFTTICCTGREFDDTLFNDFAEYVLNQDCGPDRLVFPVTGSPSVNAEYSGTDEGDFLNTMSHLDAECDQVPYVMNGALTTGTLRRTITAPELAILCALGYNVGEECTEDCLTYAVDDGPFDTSPGEVLTIPFSALLENDQHNSGVITSIYWGAAVVPGLTYEIVEEEIVITTDSPVFTQLKYEVSSCDGESCDAGFLYVNSTLSCDILTQENHCQINPFWSFDNISNSGGLRVLYTGERSRQQEPFYFSTVSDNNSPDLYTNTEFTNCDGETVTSGSQNGGKYMTFFERDSNGEVYSEGAAIPLCRDILPGESGVIAMEAATRSSMCLLSDPGIKFEFLAEDPISGVIVYDQPGVASPTYRIPLIDDNDNVPHFRPVLIAYENDTDEPWSHMLISGATLSINEYQTVSYYVDGLQVIPNPATPPTVVLNVELQESCVEDNTYTINVTVVSNQTYSFNLFNSFTLPEGVTYNGPNPQTQTIDLVSGVAQTFTFVLDVAETVTTAPFGAIFSVGDPNTCSVFQTVGDTYFGTIDQDCQSCLPCTTGNDYLIEAGDGLDLTATDLPSGGLANACLVVSGNLLIDTSYTFKNCEFRMAPGASMRVLIKNTLTLDENTFFACSAMWRGVIVDGQAELIANGNAFSDAQYAIEMANAATATIQNNRFTANYVGLYLAPNPGVTQYLNFPGLITGNTFACTEDCTLAPPYEGQFPVPEEYPYAGILIHNAKGITVGNPTNPNLGTNYFQYLQNGIIGVTADVHAHGCRFTDMISSGSFLYDPYTPDGTAIFVSNNEIVARSNRIERARTGFLGFDGRFIATSNDMYDVGWGIYFTDANSSNEIDGNRIRFVDRGIVLDKPKSWFTYSISYNKLYEILSSDLGTGIELKHVASDYATKAFNPVKSNYIRILSHGTGIHLNDWTNAQVEENDIRFVEVNLARPGKSDGINLYKSRYNRLYGNSIEADDPSNNIHAQYHELSRANVICCSTTRNTRIGFEFVGDCKGTTFRGNDMDNHFRMLYLHSGAVIGFQSEAYNTWGANLFPESGSAHAYYAQANSQDNGYLSSRFHNEGSCSSTQWPQIIVPAQPNCPTSSNYWFYRDPFQPAPPNFCSVDKKCPGYPDEFYEEEDKPEGGKSFTPTVTGSTENLSVVPNPANHELRVSYRNDAVERAEVSLLSATGQLVWTRNLPADNSSHRITVRQLPAGLYYLRVTTDDGAREHRRVVVQH